MTTTLEVIYENGIFRPLSSVPNNFREHERMKMIVELEQTKDGSVSPQLLHEMLAEGMISHIPEGITDEDDDFEPIEVEGKPLSESILEDRN